MGALPKEEKQASLEGSFRRIRIARCAQYRTVYLLLLGEVEESEGTRWTRAVKNSLVTRLNSGAGKNTGRNRSI
jgi:hypothetical protein